MPRIAVKYAPLLCLVCRNLRLVIPRMTIFTKYFPVFGFLCIAKTC